MLQKFHDRNTPNRQKMNRTTLVYQMVAVNMFFAFFNEKSLRITARENPERQRGKLVDLQNYFLRSLPGLQAFLFAMKRINPPNPEEIKESF